MTERPSSQLKSNITIQQTITRIETQQEEFMKELREREEQREIQQDRMAREILEKEKHEKEINERKAKKEQQEKRPTSGHTQDQQAHTMPHSQNRQHPTPSDMPASNPFLQHSHYFLQPHLSPIRYKVTTISGSQNKYLNSISNSNMGNTTTTIISDSNNDSSVRMTGGPR